MGAKTSCEPEFCNGMNMEDLRKCSKKNLKRKLKHKIKKQKKSSHTNSVGVPTPSMNEIQYAMNNLYLFARRTRTNNTKLPTMVFNKSYSNLKLANPFSLNENTKTSTNNANIINNITIDINNINNSNNTINSVTCSSAVTPDGVTRELPPITSLLEMEGSSVLGQINETNHTNVTIGPPCNRPTEN
eukprot:221603_1